MPRRKATRNKPATPKELPGLTVTEEMSRSEREEQLEVFFRDYNFKVKKALRTMQIEATKVELKIKSLYDAQLQQIPEKLLDMTLEDFAAAGGTFETALKSLEKPEDARNNYRMMIENKLGGVGMTAIKEESSGEQEENSPPKTVRSKRQAAAPPTTMGPPVRRSVRASAKSKFATPANFHNRPMWGATPLVTPKFDPNLPTTPDNIRDMKPGERLISIAGSPVRVDGERRKAGVGAAGLAIEDVTDQLRTNIEGFNLTPSRVERMLQIIHGDKI